MRTSPAHIAGVGLWGSESSSGKGQIQELAVTAGTKALLDAGIIFSEVDQSIACFADGESRIPASCFEIFGMAGSPVIETDNQSGLFTAVQSITSGRSNCTLMIGIDKTDNGDSKTQVSHYVASGFENAMRHANRSKTFAVGIVIVSPLFLTSHAYLKDAAASVKACVLTNRVHSRSSGGPNKARTVSTAVSTALRQADLKPQDFQIVEIISDADQNQKSLKDFDSTGHRKETSSPVSFTGSSGLVGLCALGTFSIRVSGFVSKTDCPVWELRGWSHNWLASDVQNCLQFTSNDRGAASVVILSRSDGQKSPKWAVIEHLRDGRERLGYNPATEMRGITQEDLRDVRAREEFTSDEGIDKLELPLKGGDRAALARL